MARSGVGGAGWVVLTALAVCGSGARASDVETREFSLFVDGKHRGDAQMTIHQADDGTLTMHCDTEINIKVGPISWYSYKYRGQETWKGGRLSKFRSRCDDNGKHFDVMAEARPDGLHIWVNNIESIVNPDSWLTSYWQQPDGRKHDTVVPLIDADCGKEMTARIHLVAVEQRAIAGQVQEVKHFQLTGGVRVDAWYDGAGRLVLQEWLEDGHRTRLELRNIRR